MRLFLLLALIASAASAADPGTEPFPISLKTGKSIALCKTGSITCPAASPICDDTSVVEATTTAEGLVFKGLKEGSTLCSAASSNGLGSRRVYRVTVTP
ncbi:MAG TPA: hypothetical protein VH083_13585 [Myxococcales bacterium]|nr:hypothetical protein [Myxococcales bacterium]